MSLGREYLSDYAYELDHAPEKKMFERGYHVAREKVEQGSKYIRSCFNCAFCGQENGRGEDVCLNDDVTEYDVIVEGSLVYCTQWQPYTKALKKSGKDSEIFKGGRKFGRAKLE